MGNFFECFNNLDSVRCLGNNVFLEANPPFDVFVMDRLLERVDQLLEAVAAIPGNGEQNLDLQVLFALPEWQTSTFRTDSPITRLQASRFLAETRGRRPHMHHYVKGRCWDWSKLSEERGPPLAPGVSKSRVALLRSSSGSSDSSAVRPASD